MENDRWIVAGLGLRANQQADVIPVLLVDAERLAIHSDDELGHALAFTGGFRPVNFNTIGSAV